MSVRAAAIASGLIFGVALSSVGHGKAAAAAVHPTVFRTVAFEALTVVEGPNLARQVMAVRELTLPDAGVDVRLSCVIDIDDGRLLCSHDEITEPPALEAAAVVLSDGYRIKAQPQLGGPETPQTTKMIFTTKITVHLKPAPPVDLVRGNLEPLPASAFIFNEKPLPVDQSRNYPDHALRTNRAGVAHVTCKVLDDLSLA